MVLALWRVIMLSTLTWFLSSGSITFTDEPQTVTVCEGGQAEFRCGYLGTNLPPNWFINDTTYSLSQIRSPHSLIRVPNGFGLRIDNVQLSFNSTRYLCFFYTSILTQSAIGILYVISRTRQSCLAQVTSTIVTIARHTSNSTVYHKGGSKSALGRGDHDSGTPPAVSYSIKTKFVLSTTSKVLTSYHYAMLALSSNISDYERVAVSTTFKHHLLSDSPDKTGTSETLLLDVPTSTQFEDREFGVSNYLYVGVLVFLILTTAIIVSTLIITIMAYKRRKGKRKLKSSPSHVYEEIGDIKLRNNKASNNDSDSPNKDIIGLHVNKSYDTVMDATIRLQECAAYST